MSRILPLLGDAGNREMLSEWIRRRTDHDVVDFDEADPLTDPFDLCLVDGPALGDYRADLERYRDRAAPEFVPVLLLVPTEYAERLDDDVWGSVDDIIWTSIGERTDSLNTFELSGRIRSLLRTRSMSRTLFEDQQRLKVLHRVLRHNLRNSLNVIQGAAQSMDDSGEDRYLEMIVNETNRLIGHSEKAQDVEQILDRSAEHEIDLDARVRRVVDRFSEEYPAAEVTLDVRSPARVRAIVGITRAIEEAVGNAIVHAASDSPTVEIEVDRADGSGVLAIDDSGPPLSEQDRRVLRGDLEPTPLDHGSGVGLWLIVWAVRRSEGSLQYLTREAGGNRIEIRLPAVSPP